MQKLKIFIICFVLLYIMFTAFIHHLLNINLHYIFMSFATLLFLYLTAKIIEINTPQKILCTDNIKKLQNQSNIIFYKIDYKKPGFPIIYVNPVFEETLGYKKDTILKKSTGWLSLISPEDKTYYLSKVKLCINDEISKSIDYRIKDKKGLEIWFRDEFELIRDENHKPLFIQGILINIDKIKKEKNKLYLSQKELEDIVFQKTTDLILINNALKKQNRFIYSILESITYPFFVINPDDYEIVLSNSSAYERKIKPGNKCFNSVFNYKKPCDEYGYLCPMKNILKNKEPVKTFREKNNKIEEIHCYPVFNNQRQIVNIIVYSLDITTSRKAQEKLLESEEKFRTIFEKSFIGLLIYNFDGYLMQANKAALNYLGTDVMHSLYNKNIFNLKIIPKNYVQELKSGQTIKFETKIDIINLVNSNNKSDNQNNVKDFDIIITPLSLAENDSDKIFIIQIRDITENKKFEKKLRISRYEAEEANRLKSQFLANISHDLRTPLNAIINFSRALSKKMLGEINEEQKDISDRILNSGQKLLQLINDLLDISKIESGNMDILPSNIFLPDLEKTIKDAAVPYRNEGVELITSIEDTFFFSDKLKVEQIIYNLVSNAFKYTEKGKVTVKIFKTDSNLNIIVSDTGVGIRHEDIKRIFDKYIQSNKVNKIKSTGLGLAIVKEIASLMGGYVDVESEKNIGSTFKVIIKETGYNLEKKHKIIEMNNSI